MINGLEWKTIEERIQEVANKERVIRKNLKISRKALANQSGVSEASIRRFEDTGEISLHSLVALCVALDCTYYIDDLFSNYKYRNLKDIIKHD